MSLRVVEPLQHDPLSDKHLTRSLDKIFFSSQTCAKTAETAESVENFSTAGSLLETGLTLIHAYHSAQMVDHYLTHLKQ